MSNNVYWLIEAGVREGQLENLKQLAAEMSESTKAGEPGALTYEWFLNADETKLFLFERYSDPAATMIHLDAFMKNFAAKFMSILEVKRFTVMGCPDDAVKKALGAAGAVFLNPMQGFQR